MSTPPVRTQPVRIANYTAASPDDLRDICDIWLDNICSAGWSTREAHRVAAFLTTCVYGNRTGDLYLRDLESSLNIQTEESQRALKLLKLFGVIDEVQIERGKITVEIRIKTQQRLQLAKARAEIASLAAAEAEQALQSGITALRAVAQQGTQYKFDDAELDRAIG